jgi:murein DD-endopeptidase MepM/ murein hydrolase activator NlpD
MQDAWSTPVQNLPGTDTLSRTADLRLTRPGAKSEDDATRLREAAKEFEALFLYQMMKVMRETIEESELTDTGMGSSVYTELFDQELARSMADRGALGIADLLIRGLSDRGQAPEEILQPESSDRPPAALPPVETKSDAQDIPDFQLPVHAHFSSAFGPRKDPFTHETRMHRGVDIAAPEGTEVRAAQAGRVVYSGYQPGYGNLVVVEHSGGFETRYAHLGSLSVRAGDTLLEKQVLGTVGSTGRSTGPHLHFEVRRDGNAVDPKAWVAE